MLQKPKEIPKTAGIYIFQDKAGKPLYIGKAASIKKRLVSYFKTPLPERVRQLRTEAASLTFETTLTEFDALIREAELIKKFRPKFNILMRDDKNYYYVIKSRDTFPRISVTHQVFAKEKDVLGPFTEGGPIFMVLKILRKAFPYCTCKKLHKRKCLNADIGRCFGFCCLEYHSPGKKEEIALYQKNIRSIWNILSGGNTSFLQNLRDEMEKSAKRKEFERAAKLRDVITDLQNIISHKHIIENKNPFILKHAKTAFTLQGIFHAEKPISRIEGYDISNISGTEATASLVVFQDGLPRKHEYKRFKIHYQGISDFDMLAEVMHRRLNHVPPHDTWNLPDIMLIDGGKPQLRVVAKVLVNFFKTQNQKQWPLVLAGLSKAKRPRGATKRKASSRETLHIYGHAPRLLETIPQDAMHLLQHVRDESHRFAKKYHLLLRKKKLRISE